MERKMNHLEEQYYQTEMKPVLQEVQKELLKKLVEQEEQLKKQTFQSIEALSEKIRAVQNQQEYKVAFLHFTPLQIGFWQDTYEIAVTAYSKAWYQETGVHESYYVPYLYEKLTESKVEFRKSIQKYVGKIRKSSIDYYLLEEYYSYNQYFIYFFMKWFLQLEEAECFQKLPKESNVLVTWGAYKDKARIVYAYDESEKSQEMFHQLLLKQDPAKLLFTNWNGMEIQHAVVEYKNMSGISFKKTRLQDIKFEQSFLVGANFKNSELKDCTFVNCDLKMSDFTGCTLWQVCFINCELTEVLWKDAVFHDVEVQTGESVKKIQEERYV
ncbi:hypothetical protein acsn021_08050 [Anaerocolumna cellulosilytica]|uniref:Pentapeptide repeat-containing protein n=2 Tax=Anaerocolumna cellulosilytica TaxID=433286 RepID=A0A6S6QU84_9FIRM|nr:pentapeptide repeat-containing protein [Anaerocolumna cellulosilytica]BCJ93236.1 hypothetical protein acsn021_08050 [Anaerocolumna cellulosilytica]